ncbi:MAG TPA: galactokinase [Chloroflexi bacterium]|nr:galactokinase [Chloroflexota bacterium]
MRELDNLFQDRFDTPPHFIVRAPGRVNLIGEHTDYNDGFVLPMALDRAVWLAVRPRDDGEVRLHSLDFGETAVFHLNHLYKEEGHWSEYAKGVAWALQNAGHTLSGWEGVMWSDVPAGAGLSSSAAVELAAARAFTAVSSIPWNPTRMALLAQKAENEWVGVNCGIMDQMIVAAAEVDHALLIDCRSLETESVPLPGDTAVIILDTATRRGLVESAYNERRQQCEQAADFFGAVALRDVTMEAFTAVAPRLDPLIRQRARHVITENQRVLAAVAAMRQGDAAKLGSLMNESHLSLRDDFVVSSPELDMMVAIAQSQPECYGARMTGAGFGGCAVALVKEDTAVTFAQTMTQQYQRQTNLKPNIYICQAAAGAETISLLDSPEIKS